VLCDDENGVCSNFSGDAIVVLLLRGATTKVFLPNYSDIANHSGVSPYQKFCFCIFLSCFLSYLVYIRCVMFVSFYNIM